LLINLLNNFNESTTLSPRVSHLTKAVPERNHNDLSLRPDFMNIIDQLNVAGVVTIASNVVVRIIVVGAQVDDYQIGGRMSFEVPGFWIVPVNFLGSVGSV
jgi:hypothetical protein